MHYDMEDLLEQANEIQETLGRSYAVPDEIDEADLEAGVLTYIYHKRIYLNNHLKLELDALALEEEEEGPSYLADLNKVPDFIDEAPVELEVSSLFPSCSKLTFLSVSPLRRRQNDRRLLNKQARYV